MVMEDELLLRNVSDSMQSLLAAGESVQQAQFQRSNLQSLLGRVKLLKPAIDYLREVKIPLPKPALSPFHSLDAVLHKAKAVVDEFNARRSKIYSMYLCHQTVASFQDIAAQVVKVLDTIPLSTLYISSLTRSQIDRCNQELRRLKFPIDGRDSQTSEEISVLLKDGSLSSVSLVRFRNILKQLDLDSEERLSKEIAALKSDKERNGEDVAIERLIALLKLMTKDEQGALKRDIPIPADFCCPLSQQLMSDPVIVASGQTYERAYIQQWLDQGNKTCPKTQQVLSHTTLIPNYTVKALIANWCEMHSVPLPETPKADALGLLLKTSEVPCCGESRKDADEAESLPVSAGISSSEMDGNQDRADDTDMRYYLAGIQRSSSSDSRGAATSGRRYGNELFEDGADPSDEKSPRLVFKSRKERSRLKLGNGEKLFDIIGNDESKESKIRSLVGDLSSLSLSTQRSAASELRLLAKNNAEDRIRIANAGAIKSLVALLYSTDEKVQEDSVTSLLNLSLNDGNKHDIVESGAIEPLINVLSAGNPEARQNAAATLFSLSVKQEYTALIGGLGAIPPLVELLKSGTPRGKKDAATALFNLSICHDNKAKVVKAGAVKPLIDLICDPRLGMVDKAVAVVANLSTVPDGRVAIAEEGGIPALVEVVEAGSQRGKEHAAAALLTLSSNSARHRVMVFNEGVTPMLHILAQTGTARGKEKASALLRLFREQRNGGVPRAHPRHHHAASPLVI